MRLTHRGWCGLAAGVVLGALTIPGSAWSEDEDQPPRAAPELEAIGGLSAVNAQHTYLLISVTADAYDKGAYDGKHVRTITKGVIRQLDAVSVMLRRVQDGNLSTEDDDYIEKIIDVYRLLQDQARTLNRLVDRKADAPTFDKAKAASLKAINELLGSDGTAEAAQRGKREAPKDETPPEGRGEKP